VARLIAQGEQSGFVSVRDLYDLHIGLCIITRFCGEFAEPSSAAELDHIVLVLAFLDRVPVATLKTQNWYLLDHQCSGLLCHAKLMVALPLRPKPERRHGLLALARRYFGSNIGWYDLEADSLAEFRARLDELGLPSSVPASQIYEALYPGDATQEALDRLVIDPPDLGVVTGGHPESAVICVLAPNSD